MVLFKPHNFYLKLLFKNALFLRYFVFKLKWLNVFRSKSDVEFIGFQNMTI